MAVAQQQDPRHSSHPLGGIGQLLGVLCQLLASDFTGKPFGMELMHPIHRFLPPGWRGKGFVSPQVNHPGNMGRTEPIAGILLTSPNQYPEKPDKRLPIPLKQDQNIELMG